MASLYFMAFDFRPIRTTRGSTTIPFNFAPLQHY